MKDYKITMMVDGTETTANWSGYTEQQAISQMMLSEAQNGARSLMVVSVMER